MKRRRILTVISPILLSFILGALAKRAKPKLLVLYHQLYWGFDDAKLLEELGLGYSGKAVSAADLDIYD